MLFSERKGLKPVKSVFQIDSMDMDFQNGLWNALYIHFWQDVHISSSFGLLSDARTEKLLHTIWKDYFKKPIDKIPPVWRDAHEIIREYFLTASWNEAYDFIEFIVNNTSAEYINDKFILACNYVLKREMSAYRFVNKTITQITHEEEIVSIEQATSTPNPVRIHITSALNLLSDKKTPDYRNSIKESISAVESACKLIAGDPKATLGQALNEIEKTISLHPALKSSFTSLYGYTSDAQGIRHALLDHPNLNFDDAKFMLVSCSTFINYLFSKSKLT